MASTITPPRYAVRTDIPDAELELHVAWLIDTLLDHASRTPIRCPSCGGTDVGGRNGTPPVYACACGHRWPTVVR